MVLHEAKAVFAVQNKLGRTPLFGDAVTANASISKLLIKLKCSVNIKENTGQSALFIAAAGGHSETIRLMASHRADINAVDNSGETCLFLAAQDKVAAGACRVLVEELGANIFLKNRKDETVKDVADDAVLEFLRQREAMALSDIDKKDDVHRRQYVLVFDDPENPGHELVPGTARYSAAVQALIKQHPGLNGWTRSERET